ncbi:chemotaxis protein CheA [Steroidobacter denitrificans]|uniref:Chemotaxis protein CheA n=1 Tax=Steroidobacter denitrificans TaxID=465721 RepID=A0A127FDZ3_STEDE|nr:chemotaxis protein CheA [Steroidobacter denitrificans]AMN47965.1 chemotaxis protein CheA [Steroidobacter denitrificans]
MSIDSALPTFIAESRDLLREMEADLLACEHGEANAEIVNAIFRAAHTIKGSSGLFGLDPIVEFTHVVEGVLDRIRDRTLDLTRELTAVLLECRDHLQALVDSVADGHEASDPQLTAAGVRLLERLTGTSGDVSPAPAGAAGPASAVLTPTRQSEFLRAESSSATGDSWCASTDSWHISIRFRADVLKNGMDPLSFIRYLTTMGSITGLQIVEEALPAVDHFDPETCYLGYEIGFKTDAGKQRIEAAFEFVREDCDLRILPPRSRVAEYVSLIRDLPEADDRLGELLVACGTLTSQELDRSLDMQESLVASHPAQAQPLGELLVRNQLVQPAVITAALDRQREARASAETKGRDGSLRVDGDKLDQLIDLIGELVTAGAATSMAARQAGFSDLNESTMRLARLVEEVRDQALKLRMVEIGPTFSRFRRIVRDVAREAGKEIRLEVKGGDTELDKTLIESITDPLTHLVRNAIDHGIEPAEVRRAQGKEPEGILQLNAYHEAGSVVIEVADDGNGLSRERIARKAIERGLISDAGTLTDAQVHALIFEPGFSTAERITNLSGRGVGMDVVKRNVTALRGSVEIQSREGRGTLIKVRLPLTLAIIDGFLVGVGRSSFVITLDAVEECVELAREESEAAHGQRYINLRGSVLPFIRLRDLLGVKAAPPKRESIVVVRHGGLRAGVVVDELLGEQQAVIKPLSKIFSRLQCVSGSTILGGGEVALILDIGGLVERCLAPTAGAPETNTADVMSVAHATSISKEISGVVPC